MFLGTLEELSGTFGLGRDGYLGTCDGYRGTLGTYPWDVQIMVGLLQFGMIGFWLFRDIDWDDLVMGLNGAVVCEGLISGCPPPPARPGRFSDGVILGHQPPTSTW
jgi:hypothetical protein